MSVTTGGSRLCSQRLEIESPAQGHDEGVASGRVKRLEVLKDIHTVKFFPETAPSPLRNIPAHDERTVKPRVKLPSPLAKYPANFYACASGFRGLLLTGTKLASRE